MSRSRRFALTAALLVLSTPAIASAQVRPRDSTRVREGVIVDTATMQAMPSEMMQQMDMMGPMMAQMMTVMMRSTLDALARPESAERMATFTKNYFDALVGKGFTRDEALRIVMAHGIPMPAAR